jgi:hypothetical protein
MSLLGLDLIFSYIAIGITILVSIGLIGESHEDDSKYPELKKAIGSTCFLLSWTLIPFFAALLSLGLLVCWFIFEVMKIFYKTVILAFYKGIRNKLFGKYPNNNSIPNGPYK